LRRQDEREPAEKPSCHKRTKMLHKYRKVKTATVAVMAQFASAPSPHQTGRVGVRGKHLKIKRLLTPALHRHGGGEGEKPNCATTNARARLGIFTHCLDKRRRLMSTDRGCVSSIALAKEDGKAQPQHIAGTKYVGNIASAGLRHSRRPPPPDCEVFCQRFKQDKPAISFRPR
jgi:hypothetical protein